MNYQKMTVEDIDLSGKRVLMRVDFNVPQDENQAITDDTRIRESLKTIQYLMGKSAKTILVSHLGRPKGVTEKLTLHPIAIRLSALLNCPVKFIRNPFETNNELSQMKPGEVALLENIRFYPEEEKNDLEFSKKLAKLADIYVNDAFGTAHRAHASTEGVTHHLPYSLAGFLMMKEIHYLGKTLENPERPFLAIIGGSKISSKIGVIQNLMKRVDFLIIGGGMSYTFLKAQKCEIGKSLVELDQIPLAKELMIQALQTDVPLLLPLDHVIADQLTENAKTRIVPQSGILPEWEGVDIGPNTIEKFLNFIRMAKTIFWNGPVGIFEMKPFSQGTLAMARGLSEASKNGAITIVGGGDSVAAVTQMGLANHMSHISTGGGASLEFMEGKELPGIVALSNKSKN
jgi:3-phosphoglycerate kinase